MLSPYLTNWLGTKDEHREFTKSTHETTYNKPDSESDFDYMRYTSTSMEEDSDISINEEVEDDVELILDASLTIETSSRKKEFYSQQNLEEMFDVKINPTFSTERKWCAAHVFSLPDRDADGSLIGSHKKEVSVKINKTDKMIKYVDGYIDKGGGSIVQTDSFYFIGPSRNCFKFKPLIPESIELFPWEEENVDCYKIKRGEYVFYRRADDGSIKGPTLQKIIKDKTSKNLKINKSMCKHIITDGKMEFRGNWLSLDLTRRLAVDYEVNELLTHILADEINLDGSFDNFTVNEDQPRQPLQQPLNLDKLQNNPQNRIIELHGQIDQINSALLSIEKELKTENSSFQIHTLEEKRRKLEILIVQLLEELQNLDLQVEPQIVFDYINFDNRTVDEIDRFSRSLSVHSMNSICASSLAPLSSLLKKADYRASTPELVIQESKTKRKRQKIKHTCK